MNTSVPSRRAMSPHMATQPSRQPAGRGGPGGARGGGGGMSQYSRGGGGGGGECPHGGAGGSGVLVSRWSSNASCPHVDSMRNTPHSHTSDVMVASGTSGCGYALVSQLRQKLSLSRMVDVVARTCDAVLGVRVCGLTKRFGDGAGRVEASSKKFDDYP
eukprot:365680-Chlamydomonas_euryale.AAC.11